MLPQVSPLFPLRRHPGCFDTVPAAQRDDQIVLLFPFPFFVRVSKSKAPLLRTRERGFCCAANL